MGHTDHGSGRFLSSTWSLAVEEQFYLILPLVVRVWSGRPLWLALLLLLFIGWAAKFWVFLAGGSAAAVWLPLPCRMDAFMAGALGALFIKQPAFSATKQWLGAQHSWITLTSLALFIGLSVAMPHIGLRGLALGGATLIAAIFAVVVASSSLATKGLACQFLCHPWLMGLGTISYGVYLFHLPIIGLIHAVIRHAPPSADDHIGLGVTCLGFVLTIALCTLSWRYFERPLVEYGRTMTRQPSSKSSLIACANPDNVT